MASLRTKALACLLLAGSSIHASPTRPDTKNADVESFTDLLYSVPQMALHAILDTHMAGKFQSGVFEHTEHGAMSAIHSQDPILATKLVELAKRDAAGARLQPRQASQNSSASATDPSSTSVLTTSLSTTESASVISPGPTSVSPTAVSSTTNGSAGLSTTTSGSTTTALSTSRPTSGSTVVSPVSDGGVLIPVVVSSTNAASGLISITTSTFLPSSRITASVAVPETTTNAAGSTLVTSRNVAAVVMTSTNSRGGITTMTSAIPSAAHNNRPDTSRRDVTTTDSFGNLVVLSGVVPGQVVSAVDERGRTVTLTYTPHAGQVSSYVLRTTTLPDGSVKTITSVAIVDAAQPTDSARSNASPSGAASETGNPSLQGAAVASRTTCMGWGLAAVIAGLGLVDFI